MVNNSLVLAAAVLELLVVAPGLAGRCGGLLGVAPPPLRLEWARAAVADVAGHEEADEGDDCCGHQHQHQQHARQAKPRAAARRLRLRLRLQCTLQQQATRRRLLAARGIARQRQR